MKWTLMAWATFLMAAALALTGCGKGEETTPAASTRPAATPAAAPAPEPVPTAPAPAALTILCKEGLIGRGLTALGEAYTKETGVPVIVDAQPREKLAAIRRAEFASKSGQFDLLVLDSRDLGAAVEGNHLMTLTETIKGYPELFGDVAPVALEACAYPAGAKQYYAVPCQSNVLVLAYRKDLFEDAKYKEGYRKWAAAQLVRGQEPKWPEYGTLRLPQLWLEMWYIAWYFREASGLTGLSGMAMPTATAGDGATVIFEPMLASVHATWADVAQGNSDFVWELEAFRMLAATAADPAKPRTEQDVIDTYGGGNAAMAIVRLSTLAQLAARKQGQSDYWSEGKSAFLNLPTAAVGEPATPWCGQVLSINVHIPGDQRKLAARKFLRWFSTPETQTQWAQLGGLPANLKVIGTDDFKNAAPYKALLPEALAHARIPWNVPQSDALLQISQEELSAVATGQKTPEAGAKALQERMAKVLPVTKLAP